MRFDLPTDLTRLTDAEHNDIERQIVAALIAEDDEE